MIHILLPLDTMLKEIVSALKLSIRDMLITIVLCLYSFLPRVNGSEQFAALL